MARREAAPDPIEHGEPDTMSHTTVTATATQLSSSGFAARVPTYVVFARFLAARKRHHGALVLQRFREVLEVVLEHLSAQQICAVEFGASQLRLEATGPGRFARVLHVETLVAVLESLVGESTECANDRALPVASGDPIARFVVRALVRWIRDESVRLQQARAIERHDQRRRPAVLKIAPRRAPSSPAARPRRAWPSAVTGVSGLPVAV